MVLLPGSRLCGNIGFLAFAIVSLERLTRRDLVEVHQMSPDAAGPEQRSSQRSVGEVLERLGRARAALDLAEAELDALIDRAVDLGIGWPEISAQLGVSRQVARQRYRRRRSG
ncbi:MAG TPA: hypothetical protein VMA72_22985 [Streptosporangiaceae bacterium]|nr:hypothetical protein [Streptosporangiaceae bacterium]